MSSNATRPNAPCAMRSAVDIPCLRVVGEVAIVAQIPRGEKSDPWWRDVATIAPTALDEFGFVPPNRTIDCSLQFHSWAFSLIIDYPLVPRRRGERPAERDRVDRRDALLIA